MSPGNTNSPACKCCDGPTAPFASVDANRSCADAAQAAFPPNPERVAYVRCRRCGLIFTDHFDTLSEAEMAARIYNADYVLADPDFLQKRPRHFADMFANVLRPLRETVQGLDYGGGNGLFSRTMNDQKFHFDTYDPHFAGSTPPMKRYDIVTAFEVFEHSRHPLETLRKILEYLAPDGVLLFSTQLQPWPVPADWWYLAPRNGHVSLYSELGLHVLARRCGVYFLSLNGGMHVVYRNPSSPIARMFLRSWRVRPVLYYASRRGFLPFARTTRRLAELGFWRAAAHPRHAARAILTALQRRRGRPSDAPRVSGS
jgi:2-polyprenyl-6-hydroxyphenyl methylase/3-demethylubiquinone-9 3-methyltransferase